MSKDFAPRLTTVEEAVPEKTILEDELITLEEEVSFRDATPEDITGDMDGVEDPDNPIDELLPKKPFHELYPNPRLADREKASDDFFGAYKARYNGEPNKSPERLARESRAVLEAGRVAARLSGYTPPRL